jgi:hypothetical protein
MMKLPQDIHLRLQLGNAVVEEDNDETITKSGQSLPASPWRTVAPP